MRAPYDGELLGRVPACTSEHVDEAVRAAKIVLGVQKDAVLAAKCSVVTVEEIVDELPPDRSLNAVVLPHWTVGHVVEVPGGAFPSYAQGYSSSTPPSMLRPARSS